MQTARGGATIYKLLVGSDGDYDDEATTYRKYTSPAFGTGVSERHLLHTYLHTREVRMLQVTPPVY